MANQCLIQNFYCDARRYKQQAHPEQGFVPALSLGQKLKEKYTISYKMEYESNIKRIQTSSFSKISSVEFGIFVTKVSTVL